MKMNTSSPHDKLPILEEGWRCEKDKNVSILRRVEKSSSCSRFVEIAKLIFYLELIFFIGWIGCVFLSQHIGNTNYNDSKTETSHACGPSTIDINNQIDNEHSMRGFRAKRDSDEDQLKRQSCISNMNATSEKISQLEKQIIPGEDSDPTIIALREICQAEFVGLTMRVMMEKLVSRKLSSDPTDEQWQDYAVDMKEKIINRTSEEHRPKVATLTPEISTHLRTTIESMIRNYRDCEKIVPVGDGPSTSPSIGDLLQEREKCERITASIKEDVRPVITQIIPGESSDPATVELRKKVENMTMLIVAGMTFDTRPSWKIDEIPDMMGNMTGDKWRKFMGSVRDDAVGSSNLEQRQLIETKAPITQEMIDDFRTTVTNVVNKVQNCNEVANAINHIREDVEEVITRNKRDTDPTSEYGLFKDYMENGELNIAKLFGLRDFVLARNGTF